MGYRQPHSTHPQLMIIRRLDQKQRRWLLFCCSYLCVGVGNRCTIRNGSYTISNRSCLGLRDLNIFFHFTVRDPCVTAAGEILTSPPITIVPVRELTTTRARGRSGSTSIFSSKLTKDTFCAGSIGARTLTVVESSGTARHHQIHH